LQGKNAEYCTNFVPKIKKDLPATPSPHYIKLCQAIFGSGGNIKKLRNEKGLSISEIERTMKINWRTAKKYADEDQLPQERECKKTGMMYEEKWGEM
jgi:hypothetical protein